MIFNDLLTGLPLVVYNTLIILYVSRKVSERFGTYVARKSIHILSAGVSVLLAPFVFSDWTVPLFLGSCLVAFTVFGHTHKRFAWFQIRHNYADVYFTVACTTLLVAFWVFGNVWIGVLSALFLAWGDGVTGVVRSLVYKRRNKGIWGNLAMFVVCVSLGLLMNGRVGYAGLIGAVFASVVEKFERVDDNISIPFGSAILMAVLTLL